MLIFSKVKSFQDIPTFRLPEKGLHEVREFLSDPMEAVMPWNVLFTVIEPHYPSTGATVAVTRRCGTRGSREIPSRCPR